MKNCKENHRSYVLLYDPKPYPMLCIEEPENQLYPTLMEELKEEFRNYAFRGGQVFTSTHSPDLLNHAELSDVFRLVKKSGFSSILRAQDDELITAKIKEGDQSGYQWKQAYFSMSHPK